MSAADPSMPAASQGEALASRGRVSGWWGLTFLVLLLLSAGMASVPQATDSPAFVRHFYTAHTSVIVVSQIVSLAASAAFVPFVLTLRDGRGPRPSGAALEVAGLVVAGASVLTVVPVVWLVAVADAGSDADLHGLTVAGDLTDVLLFLAITVWSAALVRASTTAAFRVLAAVVGALCLARAAFLLARSSLLEVVGPTAFLVLVLVLSALVLLRRTPLVGG